MKSKTITYWISTSLVVVVITASGILSAIHAPLLMKALAHLGYPPYFADLLGAGKLSGVAILLLPGLVRFKEWAYAGLGITVLSATYSHFRSGDGLMALEPFITFAALVVSYITRPPSRVWFNPQTQTI